MYPQTLYDKLWQQHVVYCQEHEHEHDHNPSQHEARKDNATLIYIDRHLIHEVTSPQAFEGLHLAKRQPWRVDSMIAVPDHNVPTTVDNTDIDDPISRLQVTTLNQNCRHFGITEFDISDPRQGIVHVVGPEQGATLPGMTIVCGDSHTSTHGAFGALAFGIGTSDVEHVMATQCLVLRKSKNMRIWLDGILPLGVTAKDLVLAVIGKIGTAGGTGHAIEFAGTVIDSLSMEGRMTVCNMAIEAGARSGLIAVDQTTIDYLRDRPYAPSGELWVRATQSWQQLHSDEGAEFDREISIDVSTIAPQVTWGTSPQMVVGIDDLVPDPEHEPDPIIRAGMKHALAYMELAPGTPIKEINLDLVFIGSCTNGRIEDLREAAKIVRGKRIADNIKQALVVPGSGLVKRQAESEGLHQVFIDAGFEWRNPGCSMCLAMNADRLQAGERCASTSNRNFEGRQGQGGRSHLVSPAMAAAAAIAGHFADPDRDFIHE